MIYSKYAMALGLFLTFSQLFGQDKIDYSLQENWAALPDKQDNADLVPGKKGVDRQNQSEVDVFFVHPTSFSESPENNNWNAKLDNIKVNENTDSRAIKFQASLFNQVGKIYAPRYRQANIAAYFVKSSEFSINAFDLAYKDVLDAFNYYIKHYNKGRPFILASHSQGSNHSMKLLKERIEGSSEEKQLVVAYIVGMPVAKDYLKTPACEKPDQIGCVCSWRTFIDGYVPEYIQDENPAIVTNPITWTTSEEYSDKKDHKGAVLFDFEKGIESKIMQAQVHSNVLWIKKPDIKGKMFLQRKNYHIGDYNLFYKDIQENALLRVEKYLEKYN